MFFSLVITTSYGGNLRAVLTNPQLTKPISNLEDVVNSGLSWNMVLFGENVERMLSESTDPVHKQFWRGKDILEYNEILPFHRVSEIVRTNYHHSHHTGIMGV